ncbi:SCP2 sterol-binding domain-containing protein [Lederbergia citrea]|uniref:SCP2 sterol-binding domain-containing protein n=1 Tax=Lederbergia citrea TaxID=2833581 RepID=A0A942UUX4_9BACI|nr:SCP2 sterol-binding domain-containing protein [Lederbergia citrea]MBS4224374.1 SCP2 sterol-binding domain-containing protein [Lederbergia citrea]
MDISLEDKNLAEIWQQIEKVMNQQPKPLHHMSIVYQFELSGVECGTYQLIIDKGTVRVEEGAPLESECTLIMTLEDFKKLIQGTLNSTTAYMMRRLKVEGSLGLALRLETMLRQYRLS